MKEKIVICFILCVFGSVICIREGCWLKLNATPIFEALDQIDDKYASARKAVQNHLESMNFDDEMTQAMLRFRGAAHRELIKTQQNYQIPAGMNLGGRCMIRLPDSVMFFHRMKLRNNTSFNINVLHNDIENMVLRMHLSLNDLHMKGAYERTMTDRDPSALIYSPSFGEIELLLKDVRFRVEGRYRLIKERFVIEVISSELITEDILLTHANGTEDISPLKLRKDNLGDFVARLKTNLNKWLQDYVNDYFIYYDLDKVPLISQLQKYDKEKSIVLAPFMDNSISIIMKRIRKIGGASIRVPQFSIVATHGLKVKLHDGVLQGLDTMYRRGVVTTISKRPNFRYMNSLIGFQDLKVIYKYEIGFPAGSPLPALTGVIILSANDLMGQLTIGLIAKPEVMDLDIDFLNQIGPSSITVEGAANLMIANFKHVLHHQILSIMSNTIIYGVEMLRSLPRCEPFVPGQLKSKRPRKPIKIQNNQNYSIEHVNAIDSREEILRQSVKNRTRTTIPFFKATSQLVQ